MNKLLGTDLSSDGPVAAASDIDGGHALETTPCFSLAQLSLPEGWGGVGWGNWAPNVSTRTSRSFSAGSLREKVNF